MDSVAAISAAIRERLLSGRPAPLPGLGTLVRQHVASRIEERPDGTRVLLPPGETIGLAPGADDDSLASAFGRLRGLDDAEAADAYAAAMDQLEARLAVMGEVRLPGVGLLRRTSGGVVLGVEADLLAAVNRTYEGLDPVGAPEPGAEPPVLSDAPSATDEEAPLDTVEGAPEGQEMPPAPESLTDADSADLEAEADADATAPPAEVDPLDVPETIPLSDFADAPSDAIAEPEVAEIDVTHEDAKGDIAPSPDSPVDLVGAPAGSDDGAPPEDPTAESVFVDATTLDDDLDGVLAVPFGSDAVADVLPATPPDADPSLAGPSVSVPEVEPDGAWMDLNPDDAEFTDLDPETSAPTPAPEVTVLDAEATSEDAVVVERVGPAAELASLLGGAPAMPAPPAAILADDPAVVTDPAPVEPETSAVEAPDTPAPRRRWWWLLILLAVLVAALIWAWPRIVGGLSNDAPPESIPTTVAAPDAAPDAATDTPDDSATTLAAAEAAEVAPGETATPAETSATPEAPPAPSGSAASGILPPRVAGLDAADVEALSGRAGVDPDAQAWTWVVLSTGSRSAADALADRYRTAGYRVGILEASGARRWRVGIGQFDSRDHALRLRDRLPPQAPSDAWTLSLRTL